MVRKVAYGPELLQRITAAAEQGKTREEIAKSLGVTVKTLFNLAKGHPDIDAILDRRQPEPEKYNATIPPQVSYMASIGDKTIPEMAAALGISESTWHEWCQKYPEFKKAAENGKQAILGRVADSFIDRATKQTVVIEKQMRYSVRKNPRWGKDEGAEEYIRELIEEVHNHKVHLPSEGAAKHVLAVLDRKNWAEPNDSGEKPKELTEAQKWAKEMLSGKSEESQAFLLSACENNPQVFADWLMKKDPSSKAKLLEYLNEYVKNGKNGGK